MMGTYATAQSNIAAMLSVASGKTIAAADFNVVAIKTNTDSASTLNTKAIVNMTSTSAYAGMTYVYYDRLDLASITSFPRAILSTIFADATSKVSELLDQVKNVYGIRLSIDDIDDATVITNSDGSFTLPITAKTTSIGWIGSVSLPASSRPNIIEAFNTNILNGF